MIRPIHDKDDRVKRNLEAATYRFAKSMPKHPHWYTLREWWDDQGAFAEPFFNTTYIYLYHDGWKYWTMGTDVSKTILINTTKAEEKFNVTSQRS